MLALPDLPLAVLALGLLVTVVVASLVAVRRRLSYEVRHGIHLLSYLAVAGALPHQLSAGGILAEGAARCSPRRVSSTVSTSMCSPSIGTVSYGRRRGSVPLLPAALA